MKRATLVHGAIAGAMMLAFGVGAQAAPFTSYLQAGSNVIEDDSNEYIFRPCSPPGVGACGPTGYQLVTSGNIQVGDVLVQILDFPIINGTNIDSNGDELTGIALNVVQSISGVTVIDPPGPVPAYNAVDINFVQATAADWLALTGINTALIPVADPSELAVLIFYDESNDLDVFTQGFPASLAPATNGDLTFALTLTDPVNDFIAAQDVPLDIGVFAPSAGELPGVTIYGTFSYGLTTGFFAGPGEAGNVGGSGNNLVTDRASIAAVIDDTQATFTFVPEPGTLALLGLGLLGLGGLSRRKAGA